MFPIIVMVSLGYPRSAIIAKRRAWSMEPNELVKSIYTEGICLVSRI